MSLRRSDAVSMATKCGSKGCNAYCIEYVLSLCTCALRERFSDREKGGWVRIMIGVKSKGHGTGIGGNEGDRGTKGTSQIRAMEDKVTDGDTKEFFFSVGD